MIHLIIYLIAAYLIVGTVIYVLGHPLRERVATTAETEHSEGKTNMLYRHLAHSAQAINFLVHSSVSVVTREPTSAPIAQLYEESVRRAFDPKHLFITTGAPHSRGMYLRNFAWFYPDLLSPATIIDEADRKNRIVLLERSIRTALETMGTRAYTTTIIPLTARRFAAVNYVTPPSDSLLGILAGLEQLTDASRETGYTATEIIAQYKKNIERELARIAAHLEPIIINRKKYLLLDARKNMSSATDTRNERMRFVVSANVWATFAKAERLGLMDGKVFAAFGLDKTQYKKDILELFGAEGYICDSLAPSLRPARATDNITLDFAHIHNGFWNFSDPDEQILFKNTVDLIFSDPTFRDISNNCYFVSRKDPDCDLIHRYATPSYHGRTVWSSFNVELADRLLDLAHAANDESYRSRAERILLQLKEDTERNGGYPELIDANGEPYRTWIYKSAVADSWFPRFAGVWHRTFGVRP